jgi:zinc and cadmium transporter|tara:strand:+ start:712 stop:1470 length:759 start_codon:yes stop_codon:yes gene_type:complete
MVIFYAIGSSIIVSLVAIIGTMPLLLKQKIPNKVLILLLSISVGTLFGTAFMQLLPEAVSHGYTMGLVINLMIGFLTFFALEKFIHARHNHKDEGAHSHGYCLAPLNLIGDGVHNFVDGLVIGASYMISIPLGIASTISIALHELPQEIADFGLLLYSGYSKKKAIFYNFISALTAVVGTINGLILSSYLGNFNSFILPFTVGVFLYIGASNLVPELHRHCDLKDSISHIFAIVFGLGIIALITIYGPGHTH